ncbi:MAG: heme-binding domain-containing protein [Cyclobacteriaceae bacterium]
MKRAIIGIVLVLLVMQLFKIDKSMPEMEKSHDFISITNPPKRVSEILENACYDCHSYKTSYPWYTDLAPVSWWVKNHINKGRKHLNFSIWAMYDAKKQDHKLEEIVEEVEEKEMPLNSYTWVHDHAILSENDRKELIEWVKSKRTYIAN